MHHETLLDGFLLSLSLLAGIGPQNLFVLRQGIAGSYALTAAFVSTFGDLVLLGTACLGIAAFVRHLGLETALAIAGAAMIALYGGKAAIRLVQPGSSEGCQAECAEGTSRISIVLSALEFSFLNPLVYSDLFMIFGGAASQLPEPPDRLALLSGGVAASLLWFLTLALAPRQLARFLAVPTILRCVDLLSVVVSSRVVSRILATALTG